MATLYDITARYIDLLNVATDANVTEEVYGATAFYLIEFENQYGTEKLKQALIDAAKGNKYDRISYNYLKAVLENKGGRSVGSIEQYSKIADDEVPEGY